MNLGKKIRLNRIFSHSSGRLCSVAIDHFLGYHAGMHPGLADLPKTIAALVSARPDAITMHKGVALSCWGPYAGRVSLILQSVAARPDDTADEVIALPEDAVRLGADGFATASFVRGASEAAHLRRVADLIRQAEIWEMPVLLHTYPRSFGAHGVEISYTTEDIAWAVRCGIEVGADVLKTPYCGDAAGFAQIVRSCPVPLVAAGGPQCRTLLEALQMAEKVVESGAQGLIVGRNVWGAPDISSAVRAFKAVVHDLASPEQVLQGEPATQA